jgi:hypothetical protein
MKYKLILMFFNITILSFGQTIVYDTLHQNTRVNGTASMLMDTTIKVFPTADNFVFHDIPQEILNRIDTSNFDESDAIGVTLLITKIGKLDKITIIQGHRKDCIDECIRVIKTFQHWTPAILESHLVSKHNNKSTFHGDIRLSFLIKMKKQPN